jgi:hypothetical protein
MTFMHDKILILEQFHSDQLKSDRFFLLMNTDIYSPDFYLMLKPE